MKEWIKREGENLKEYKIRLMKNKDLYNLTWEDIKEILNEITGEEWGESKYRKWWYAFKEGMEYAINKNLSDKEILNELEEKQKEFYKEKIKYSDQKRENAKILRRIARAEHLIEVMKNSISELNEKNPIKIIKPITYVNKENREGVAIFSDWHFGLNVENYWNKFNKNEFKRRIEKLTGKIIKYGKEQGIKKLHVFLLGDLINGIIRVKTRVTNEEDVITQTMVVSEIIAQIVSKFAEHFEQVLIYSTLDNHSRITPNKEEELEVENFARLITWYLRPRLQEIDNIEIIENKYDIDIITANVCGYKVYGVHGHNDKVSNVVQNLTLMTREFPDYICFAHVHHNTSTEVHGVEVIVNPSLVGVDDYAKNIRKTSKPAQKLLIFDKSEGLLCTYSIRLDN